jgi:hypothetical protein
MSVTKKNSFVALTPEHLALKVPSGKKINSLVNQQFRTFNIYFFQSIGAPPSPRMWDLILFQG